MEQKKDVGQLAAMFGGSKQTATNKGPIKPVGKLQTPSVFGGAKKDDPKPLTAKKETDAKVDDKVESGNVKSLTAMFERKSTVKLDQDKGKFLSNQAKVTSSNVKNPFSKDPAQVPVNKQQDKKKPDSLIKDVAKQIQTQNVQEKNSTENKVPEKLNNPFEKKIVSSQSKPDSIQKDEPPKIGKLVNPFEKKVADPKTGVESKIEPEKIQKINNPFEKNKVQDKQDDKVQQQQPIIQKNSNPFEKKLTEQPVISKVSKIEATGVTQTQPLPPQKRLNPFEQKMADQKAEKERLEKEKADKEQKKKLDKIKQESEKPADQGDDFKNSLAALLTRGKPGASKTQKKPQVEEKKTAPKKMSIFDGEDDDDEDPKVNGQPRRMAVVKQQSSEISMMKPTVQRRQRNTVAAKAKKYDFDSD